MTKKIIINTDGGARGNPGPAAIGVVVYDDKNNIIKTYKEKIGEATNNYAEYAAVVKAFELINKLKVAEVVFKLDSELAVNQLNYKFKIKNEDLGKLFIKIWNAKLKYKKVSFQHVPREENRLADKLVNEALDNK